LAARFASGDFALRIQQLFSERKIPAILNMSHVIARRRSPEGVEATPSFSEEIAPLHWRAAQVSQSALATTY